MDWNYILTSVAISIIISTTTFIFGLKAGKNQSVWPFLIVLFKKLYSHFLKLFTAIDSNRPPKWADYKKVNTQNGYRYIPLIEELTNEGELVELSANYSKKLLEIERDILILSRKQYSTYEDIENHIISFLTDKIGEQLIKEQYAYTTSNNTQGKSFIPVNYSIFY